LKVALAQINPTVGDVVGNARLIEAWIRRAEGQSADLVVFPELAVLGYPPRDLLDRGELIAASVRAVEALAGKCRGVAALVGFARPAGSETGRPLENAAALLADGKVQAVRVKTLPPSYDVFDETRYFRPGPPAQPVAFRGVRLGVTICEDLWDPEALERPLYQTDPVARLAEAGAEIIVNMSASPFEQHKIEARLDLVGRQAARARATTVYVNQVGGNDELVFDGTSTVIRADGEVLGRCRGFAEDLLVVDTSARPGRCEPVGEEMPQLHEALTLGLRDYVHKCGFSSVVLGLSGGIDSAVVATIAADALGPENVLGLGMPSRYSSPHSLADARQLAETLGIRWTEVPIDSIHKAFEDALNPPLPEDRPATTDENVQARIRGVLVMAFSNATGRLALATGNKSELATGYCTLYGDMCGGLAVIGDVPKTSVYRLARYLNEITPGRIPDNCLRKAPSAELKPDQTDQDKLPPYEALDEVLHKYVTEEKALEQIVNEGCDEQLTRRVVEMVQAAEYKRRQAAPILKVTSRAFGTGRRMPLACRVRTGPTPGEQRE